MKVILWKIIIEKWYKQQSLLNLNSNCLCIKGSNDIMRKTNLGIHSAKQVFESDYTMDFKYVDQESNSLFTPIIKSKQIRKINNIKSQEYRAKVC